MTLRVAIGRISAALALPALAACSLAPTYERPAAPVPPAFPTGEAYPALADEELPAVSYPDVLLDARLQELVRQALANNRDLRIAAANLAEARAQVRVTRAAQFPQVTVGASADYSAQPGPDGQSYALQGGISNFELDLFGRLANATRAQRELALASAMSEQTVRIGLVADIASTWATYAADRDLLLIARDTVDNAQRSVDLTRARLEGGIAPRTDLRQAEQVLLTAQGDVAQQTAALAQDVNLMELLVGAPVDRALLPDGLAEAMEAIATPPAGTSSQVLLRRPDVAEAEYRLRAANADIGVARAELFPRISLSGIIGYASDTLGSLLTGDAFGAVAGGDVNQRIFNAGGVRAGVAVSKARRDAALAGYELAIQAAFREIADALATQGTIAERLDAARRNAEAAEDSAQLTEARYRGGIDSFLGSLITQRSLYTARREQAAISLVALQNRIELYRVLGSDTELTLASPAAE